jgi:hypothetical protein
LDRDRKLRQTYGITLQDYEVRYLQQKGMCGLCGNTHPNTGRHSSLCVDHDHKTGRIRGLLCHRCNRALGLLGDGAVILRRALNWVEFSNE